MLKRALGLVVLAALAACAGTAAREHTLLPAMRLAWPGVQAAVARGITTGLEAQSQTLTAAAAAELTTATREMKAALETGEAGQVAAASVMWPALEALAFTGIDARVRAGEIGSGVAESLRERVRQFSLALIKFLRR